MNLKIEDYQFNKTNIYGDPCKGIKNENQIIANVGLKDSELIFLKNIAEEINEDYLITLYKGNNFEDFNNNNNNNNNYINEFYLSYVNDEIEKIKNPKSFIFNEIPDKNFILDFYVRKFSLFLLLILFYLIFIYFFIYLYIDQKKFESN